MPLLGEARQRRPETRSNTLATRIEVRCSSIWCGRHPFEKELYGHLQDIGNVLQAACPDPVGALLVLLDLLKRHAKCITELLLSDLKRISPHAQPAAHMRVGRLRLLPFTSSISRDYQRRSFHSNSFPETPPLAR